MIKQLLAILSVLAGVFLYGRGAGKKEQSLENSEEILKSKIEDEKIRRNSLDYNFSSASNKLRRKKGGRDK